MEINKRKQNGKCTDKILVVKSHLNFGMVWLQQNKTIIHAFEASVVM